MKKTKKLIVSTVILLLVILAMPISNVSAASAATTQTGKVVCRTSRFITEYYTVTIEYCVKENGMTTITAETEWPDGSTRLQKVTVIQKINGKGEWFFHQINRLRDTTGGQNYVCNNGVMIKDGEVRYLGNCP